MGDRISIQFACDFKHTNGSIERLESPILFSHYDGKYFAISAQKFIKEIASKKESQCSYPLDRCEPGTVMVAFIQWYLSSEDEVITNNYYLEKSTDDGDNDDNGHYVINSITGEIIRHDRGEFEDD
jgi:hypothetical protein